MDKTDRTDDAPPTNGLGRYGSRFYAPGAAAGLDRTWVLIALLVPALVAFVSKTSTIDLAYHVRSGLQILSTHGVPRLNTYSFGAAGAHWFDQQWLSQVVFAGAWKAGGWATVIAVRGLMVSLGMGTLYLACRWLGARPRTSVFLSVGGFLLALPNLSARPQILAVPLFTATLWLLASRRTHPRRLWLVPPLVVVWSNVHGSFPLAILIIGLALAADLLDRDLRSAGRTALTLLGAALATSVTPFGPTVWTYVWDLLRNPQIRKGVSEWEPPRLDSVWGVAFWVSAAGAIVLAFFRRAHVRVVDILTLLAFAFMGAEAGRNELWWGLVLPVVVAGWFPARLDAPVRETTQKREGRPIKLVLAAATIALLPWWRGSSPGAFLNDAPTGVVTAVRAQPPGSRVFAPQVWGSWFEREAPDQLPFLDSRIELYPPPLWQDYVTMYNAKPGWEAAMTRWRVSVVALPNDAPLERVIGHSLGWTQIYRGSDGAVFVAGGTTGGV